jgi:DNA-binding MarR family transcriptional regulator
MGGVTKNNHYNFQNLIKNGYLIHKKGRLLGMDNRCVFLQVTQKGNDLYKQVCVYLDSKMQELRKELRWEDENFSDYFADLTALQEFMAGQ